MLPYVIAKPIRLGPIELQPFGLLVAIGVTLGWALVARRGKKLGFADSNVQAFLWWMAIGGFVGGHVFDVLMYHPEQVLRNPLKLLMLWNGLSSFGGFGGATIGGIAWKYFALTPIGTGRFSRHVILPVRRKTPMPLLPYADIMIANFPITWIFGRSGCSVVHDHPGALAPQDCWYAVAYGDGRVVDYGLFALKYGNAPRYDLGLIELFFTLFIALGFALAWKRGGAKGYFVAAASIVYAPLRFFLDFLRLPETEGGDPRYFALTPAQWACVVLLFYGFWVLWFIRKNDAAQHLQLSENPNHA